MSKSIRVSLVSVLFQRVLFFVCFLFVCMYVCVYVCIMCLEASDWHWVSSSIHLHFDFQAESLTEPTAHRLGRPAGPATSLDPPMLASFPSLTSCVLTFTGWCYHAQFLHGL